MYSIRILFVITVFLVSLSTHAEIVEVKNLGNIDLSDYQCSFVSSSVVNRICFNDKKSSLILLFRSNYYAYCRIPKSVVNELASASSIGQYFNANIKGNYDCR